MSKTTKRYTVKDLKSAREEWEQFVKARQREKRNEVLAVLGIVFLMGVFSAVMVWLISL